jgi:hypothetical protein
MSAAMPGAFDPANPFSSQKGGTYDPGALQGLYLRAQKGDINARKYLSQIGVLGTMGQDIWANNDTIAGRFAPAINAWAQQTGSTPYAGPGFAYQDKWATSGDDPTFARAWDSWFQTGGQGTDFQKLNPADPGQPGNTSKPSITGNPPAATSSPYGYTYATPQGYNAWALYNGGTNDGGYYDANADRQTFDSGRGNGSTSNTRDTIMRWTLDDLRNGRTSTGQRYDPGTAPLDVVNAAFANNVARMHRDFDKNGYNWQDSGFAKFDAVPGSRPASQAGGTRSDQTTPPPPGTPPGTPPPNGAPPPTYKDPITGEVKTYQGNLDPTQLAKNSALSDPNNASVRLSYILRQYGIDPTRAGVYTASLAKALSPQIEAFNQTRGLLDGVNGGSNNWLGNTTSDLNSFAQQAAASGGFGQIQQQARNTLADPRFQTLAGAYTDPQVIDVMQTLLAQAYAGANPLYNQARQNQFQSAFGQGGAYDMYSLDHPQNAAPGFQHPLDWLRGTPWANLLAGY